MEHPVLGTSEYAVFLRKMADSSQLILLLILRHLHHFWINCVLCQIHAENSQKRIKEQPNSKKLMQYEKKEH